MSSKIGPPFDYVLEEEVDDELLLYNSESRRFLSLNQSAADVWRLADGESTEDIKFRDDDCLLDVAPAFNALVKRIETLEKRAAKSEREETEETISA